MVHQHAGACPRGFDASLTARTFLEGRPRAVHACACAGIAALLPARVGLSVSVSLFNKELSFSSLRSSLLAYFADIPRTRVDFDLCCTGTLPSLAYSLPWHASPVDSRHLSALGAGIIGT